MSNLSLGVRAQVDERDDNSPAVPAAVEVGAAITAAAVPVRASSMVAAAVYTPTMIIAATVIVAAVPATAAAIKSGRYNHAPRLHRTARTRQRHYGRRRARTRLRLV